MLKAMLLLTVHSVKNTLLFVASTVEGLQHAIPVLIANFQVLTNYGLCHRHFENHA